MLTTGMGGKAYSTLRPLLRVFPCFLPIPPQNQRKQFREGSDGRRRGVIIEQERQNRAHLVGEAFTVADLTAAALLGALLQPPEIQYPLQVKLPPPYLKDYCATLLRHPAAQWAVGIYRLHRGSAKVARHA